MSDVPSRKVALVTGAGSGIGRASAHALLAADWTVVLCGRRLPALEEVIAASAHQDRALALACDVTDELAVQVMFETIRQRFGRLDLLFNNAGVFTVGAPLEDLPVSAYGQSHGL
ncbi:MAG: hypothetical protein C4K60_03595 [Ideonella sp. MAG2]|nr:MAG: hypothetical protein C4K60_03595 [Ideonella sp. MAG2]